MSDQLQGLSEDQDDSLDFAYLGQTFKMRKRFKRLKFLRLLQTDPASAVELAFGPQEYARIEDVDMTDEEFKQFLNAFADRFAGNSGAS